MYNSLKSLSQEAKDLMDEIQDANNDIDYNKLFLLVVTTQNLTIALLVRH